MKEQLVSFKTAKLAKKKGFKEPVLLAYRDCVLEDDNTNEYSLCDMWYNANGLNKTKFKEVISAPTQSLLQKWLREVHNLIVIVEYYPFSYSIANDNLPENKSIWIILEESSFSTYEKALEKGLYEALNLIK